MIFSPQQEHALHEVEQWLSGDKQVFRLFGYAGTGKTTLAKYLNADGYAAFTGKAAHVLRTKGCDATTIHSLIYLPREKSGERLRKLQLQLAELQNTTEHISQHLFEDIEAEKANLRRPAFTLNLDSPLREYRLLVIDECSMVNAQVGEDLLSFGCRVLVLGDPAQLPPVRGGGFFTECEPDILLTEIHRQALGNPILDLATRIREGRLWDQHLCVLTREVSSEDALAADQIIVGRNKTRHAINRRNRQLLGHTGSLPVVADKVVCTRNNHELGIMNGATYVVTDVSVEPAGRVSMELDGGLWVTAHAEGFTGGEVDYYRRLDAEQFEYGYALTCHKSQGSQWDNVLVFNEGGCFPEPARWLYTAVTRAAQTLKVVL